MASIKESTLPNLIHRGKVRDTHDLRGGRLLMVATDRISAFDVVLPNTIPDKGAILSQMSAWWFGMTRDIIPNHVISPALDNPNLDLPDEYVRRSTIVRRAERIDVECIARGYITGHAWIDYEETGKVWGAAMPKGLKEGDKFPETLFTPTTKAGEGHDENMTVEEVENIVGADTTQRLAETTIAIYQIAQELALDKGIIIADTKLEFGFIDGELTLIDELLTPDSSRFWDMEGYEPGKTQPNFDKQFVRNWLNTQVWDRTPPAPELPDDIVEKTRSRYLEAFERLTSMSLH